MGTAISMRSVPVFTTFDSLNLRAHAAACRVAARLIFAVVLAASPAALVASVTYEVLSSFEKPGTQVVAPLVQHSDGNFYGVASTAGARGFGSVFKITPGGTLSTLFSFSGSDGNGPVTGLVEGADQALYGSTSSGGTGNFGVVYKITTAGVFTKLADFTGSTGAARGSVPHALMRHANGNFYGVTQAGGAGGFGTVFSMTPAGVVTTLAELTGTTGARPGSEPLGPLAVSGNLLYGVTKYGGTANLGVIFEVSITGTWRAMGEFTGTTGTRPGANPAGGLLMNTDGALYGTAEFGGTNSFGVAFKITTATTPVYTVLRHFADPTGSQPAGTLVRDPVDGQLWGTTSSGGTGGWGTVYKITTAGVHTLLASFTGQTGIVPGASPRGGMALSAAGPFQAVTSAGAAGNLGQAFKVASAGTFTALAAVSLPNGWNPSGAPVASGNGELLFPMAAGGTGGGGNLISLSITGNVTIAAALGGTLGSMPDGALNSAAGGVFYGVTARGGASSRGTLFRYTPGSGAALILAYTTSSGSLAEGPLVPGADGLFYGVGREGGASSRGALYKVTTAGVRTRLASFSGTAGAVPGGKPRGPLALASDGNFYGLTEDGGSSVTGGVIFRLTSAGVYSVISHFNASGARSPMGGFVIGNDGLLYATTSAGGAANAGTLISFNPATGNWSILGEFTGLLGAIPGSQPAGELFVAPDGAIYGMTLAGGASDQGTVFRYSSSGGLESLVAFTGASGAAPGAATANDGAGLIFTGGIALGSDGKLYGVAPGSGAAGGGVVFRLTITPPINDWKLANFGNANATDTDDLDFDGIPNLLEYALVTTPGASDAASLPKGQLAPYPDGDWLTIMVTRDPTRRDITLIVEVSATLQPTDWTVLATSTLGAPFTGPGYYSGDSATPGLKTVTIRDIQPVSALATRFIRIRVIH